MMDVGGDGGGAPLTKLKHIFKCRCVGPVGLVFTCPCCGIFQGLDLLSISLQGSQRFSECEMQILILFRRIQGAKSVLLCSSSCSTSKAGSKQSIAKSSEIHESEEFKALLIWCRLSRLFDLPWRPRSMGRCTSTQPASLQTLFIEIAFVTGRRCLWQTCHILWDFFQDLQRQTSTCFKTKRVKGALKLYCFFHFRCLPFAACPGPVPHLSLDLCLLDSSVGCRQSVSIRGRTTGLLVVAVFMIEHGTPRVAARNTRIMHNLTLCHSGLPMLNVGRLGLLGTRDLPAFRELFSSPR